MLELTTETDSTGGDNKKNKETKNNKIILEFK
jgi:hypothetical protein